MRGAWGIAVILAIAAASIMFSLSGYGGIAANDPTDGLGPVEDGVESTGETANPEKGVSGQISGDDPSIVSVITNSAGAVTDVAVLVLLLPVALNNLGFPYWFATPVGLVAQLGAFVSIAQFAAGRVLR